MDYYIVYFCEDFYQEVVKHYFMLNSICGQITDFYMVCSTYT